MKKIFLAAGILVSSFTFAQNITLKKGQQIIITSTATQNTEMMGMEIKSNSTSTNKLLVEDVTNNAYKATNTLTRLKVDADIPMQAVHFDSDKKEDMDSDNGKEIGNEINKPKTVLIDKKTGEVHSQDMDEAPDTSKKNSITDMMGGMLNGSDNATVTNAFFNIASDKKVGSSWSDSSKMQGIKSVTVYTIQSIENGIATINTAGTMAGTTSLDLQGNQVNVDINSTINGKIIVNNRTGLVSSRTTAAEVKSTIEIMGQSMPVTGTATSTTTYE